MKIDLRMRTPLEGGVPHLTFEAPEVGRSARRIVGAPQVSPSVGWRHLLNGLWDLRRLLVRGVVVGLDTPVAHELGRLAVGKPARLVTCERVGAPPLEARCFMTTTSSAGSAVRHPSQCPTEP